MKTMNRILAATLAAALPLLAGAAPEKDFQVELPAAPAGEAAFSPPAEETIPDNAFGEMVRLGRDLVLNTDQLRGTYTGNGMKCVNCHLDRGRRAGSAPLWAAFGMYPAYRKKNDKVNTMEERIQGCFTYSMNGTPPPAGSRELTALVTYHYWLATGAPIGKALPGRGFPKLARPEQAPDFARGEAVYRDNCALCHGDDGAGRQVDGRYVFPPLWGPDSYNWGAGMHRVNTAAGFIKANMPLSQGGSLTDQQAWDVALYINSHDRPQDPRFEGDLAETKKTFHGHQCEYGEEVGGHALAGGAE